MISIGQNNNTSKTVKDIYIGQNNGTSKRVYEVVADNKLKYWYGGPYYKNGVLQSTQPFIDSNFLSYTEYEIPNSTATPAYAGVNPNDKLKAFFYKYYTGASFICEMSLFQLDALTTSTSEQITLTSSGSLISSGNLTLRVKSGNVVKGQLYLNVPVNSQVNNVQLWGYPYGSGVRLDLSVQPSSGDVVQNSLIVTDVLTNFIQNLHVCGGLSDRGAQSQRIFKSVYES